MFRFLLKFNLHVSLLPVQRLTKSVVLIVSNIIHKRVLQELVMGAASTCSEGVGQAFKAVRFAVLQGSSRSVDHLYCT